MGILEIDRLADRARDRRALERRAADRLCDIASYDLVVVDTAPTGHTLRLLSAPETVAAVAEVLGALQQRAPADSRTARARRPSGSGGSADRAARGRRRATPRRGCAIRTRTAFVWVTLPEELSLDETGDGIAALERAGITRRRNRSSTACCPTAAPCPICDRRRVDEREAIAAIRRRFGRGRTLRVVPAERQRAARHRSARCARRAITRPRLSADGADASDAASAVGAPAAQPPAVSLAHRPLATLRGASLLFFGGKGGVGKTTVRGGGGAAAGARAIRERRVLLLSTDPAHSLGDVFGARRRRSPRARFRARRPNLVRARARRRRRARRAPRAVRSRARRDCRGGRHRRRAAPAIGALAS